MTLHTNPKSKKQNFFQNYADHVNYFPEYYKGFYKNYMEEDVSVSLWQESLRHLTMFDQLHDRYDYFDLMPGIIVPSIAGLIAAGVSFVAAIGDLYASIMTNNQGLVKGHLDSSLKHLDLAGTLFVMSIVGLLNNLLSVITRPIATCALGWNKDNAERFAYDSKAETAVKKVNNFIFG